MRHILILILALNTGLMAQNKPDTQTMQLNLQEMIDLAKLQSIASFRSKNMYLSNYWQFRSYKASLLPALLFSTNPFNYNRAVNEEYDFDEGIYKFVPNETLSSSADLSIRQNITMTGGALNLTSSFRRLENLSPKEGVSGSSYTAIPIELRLSQPLNGYNEFKWQSKLAPLAFEKAKKSFIKEMEDLSEQAVGIFFGTINAEIGLNIATTNLANADTLYRIGKGRYQIGTITQNDLLDLELTYLNAKMSKTKAEIDLQRARNQINSFLGISKEIKIIAIIPDEIPQLKIDADQALSLAKENSPEILGYEEQLISANQKVARSRSSNGLTADLSANFGVNSNSDTFNDLYNPPYNQNRGVGLTLKTPIVDWGNRKGQIQMAKSERQVTEATIKQSLIDFEQNIIMQVLEFNLQEEQVAIAAKADTIAQKGFEVTKQRFLIDKVDVLKLNTARNSLESSKRSYIGALQTYWRSYFNIRKTTLYDFEKGIYLTEDFDALLQP